MIHSTTRETTTPDEWARLNRVYSQSTGRPGPRDPSYTPYMIEFTRCFDRAYQQDVYGRQFEAAALACGSQMAKTEAVLDICGWSFDQRPAPLMYVGPTKEFLKDEIEPRLMEMLNGTRSLRDRLATGKATRQFRKVIGGVPLRLVWAGSSAALRGMAAKIVLVDELDAMADDVQGNGDPFALTESRGFSFADRMRGAISTPLLGVIDTTKDEASGLEFWRVMPTEDVSSPIWRLFQKGTMHHWSWPCPHCGEYFIPRFKLLHIADDATPASAERDAFVECPHCGGVIEENHKADLNARGRYVAPGQSVLPDGTVVGPIPDVTMLSFWVSGLCSPMVTFGQRAKAYVTAKLANDEKEKQAVINTGFGECYAPGGGDVPEWHEVAALRRAYRAGELPEGARLLTLAVDVQKNRLVYTVRGWGAFATSWLVAFGEIIGPTTQNEVWDQLALLLTTPIDGMPIRLGFIDSGFRPGKPITLPVNKVYEFCRRFRNRVYPTKGRATQDKPIILGKNDVTARGDIKKYGGLELLWLDTDHFKSWVHERIRWEPDAPGAWFLPENVTDDFCKQIVAEARVKKPTGQPEWIARSRENHYLDCEAMQAALAHMLNVHLLRPDGDPPSPPPAKPVRAAPRPAPPAKAAAAPPARPPEKPAAARPANAREERRKRIAALSARLYGAR